VFPLILLYWLENVIVGGFSFVHGTFVFAKFGGPADAHQFFPSVARVLAEIRETGIRLGVLGLLLSHGVSFVGNYLIGGEYRRASLQRLMSQPYVRVMVMHVVILFGGWLVILMHSPVPALAMLVLLKTAVDLRAERQRLGVGSAAPVTAVEPSL
jgi:uncharacterized protein DUF6498